MDDEDSQEATPMAVLGEFSALNYHQHTAIKHSPPRTKRVFVLADASRSQTKSFIPISTEAGPCPTQFVNSPAKARAIKKDQKSSSVCQIGARAKDDATFLALLHIEPLVDRDLFRALCDDLASNGSLGTALRFGKASDAKTQERTISYQTLRMIRPDIGNNHLATMLEAVSCASETLFQDSIFRSSATASHDQDWSKMCRFSSSHSALFHVPAFSSSADSSASGPLAAVRLLPSPYHSALPPGITTLERPRNAPAFQSRRVRSVHMQCHSFAARLVHPGRHRNVHSILLMREVLGDRTPHNVMSRLEMKRFSTSANLIGHCDAVYCLAVNTENSVVLTGSDDLRVKAWSICPVAGVGLISTMRGHQGVISQVMFNPQDESIAISSDSSFCAVRFWRIANGQQLRLIISHEYNGREDMFFELQNCMDKFLITTTRNEIKFWSFGPQQQRLSLDDRGEPELHVPEFGVSFPQADKGKHIGIIAVHPSLPIALAATDAGTLYLMTMLPSAGPNQFVALKQQGKDGKEPLFTKEITELSWNRCGTRFVVAGKNWDSSILIVPFKYDAARCFIAAATSQCSKEEAVWNRESAPKRDSGSKTSTPKRIYLENLVGTKDIQRIDLKALDEAMINQEKFDDALRYSKGRSRPAQTGCKEITCISWSCEGARIIVGCCPTSLISQHRSVTISKASVRVFCAFTTTLLVSFDQVHDRPISSILPHPSQSDIFMTASYDGDVKICDMSSMRFEALRGTAPGCEDAVFRVPSLPFNVDGCKIMQTFNGKPQVSHACWQRSDTIIVARKSGHISLINAAGFSDPIRSLEVGSAGMPPQNCPIPKKWRCRVWGSSSDDQILPEDHFYQFERRKLKWDHWGTAVDEVTEARTHLMPRGPLCNRHYESYEAFGYDAGVWEQMPADALQNEDVLTINTGAAAALDEDDDEILVQPLPIGSGRRVVDSTDSSESGDLYDESDNSDESESSGSVSSNSSWSGQSSDDDFQRRRRSTRAVRSGGRKKASSTKRRAPETATSRPGRSNRRRKLGGSSASDESHNSDSDSVASRERAPRSAAGAKQVVSRPKAAATPSLSTSAAAAYEPKQRRFGVDPWSRPAYSLVGAAEADRKWISKQVAPRYLDDVYVPQVGDAVHYFRSGHCKARARRDPDPVKQLIDDSVSIWGKDISLLPYRIKGTVQSVTPRIWVGRKLDRDATELKQCDKEFHVVLETVISCEDAKTFVAVYHSEDQWLVPDWLYARNADRISEFMEGGFRIRMRFEDDGDAEGCIPRRRLTRGSVPSLEDEWLAHEVKWDNDANSGISDDLVDDSINYVSHWEVVVQREDGHWIPDPPMPPSVSGAETLIALIDAICDHPIASGLFDSPVNLKDCPNYTDSGGIALPMDLSLIRSRLSGGFYRSLDAVLSDVDLMARNAHHYNDEDLSNIPAFAEAVYCVMSQHIFQLQRRNSGDDDQPMQLELEDSWERSIWSQELRPTLEQFKKCLSKLKQCDRYKAFGAPVDEDEAPGYSKIITHKMDLGTMSDKITSRQYAIILDSSCDWTRDTFCMYVTWDDFMADVTLLVENCIAYNKADSDLSVVAERIRKEAQEHIASITSQWRPEIVAKKFNIKMTKVFKRSGLRAAAPPTPVPVQSVKSAPLRLKFNVGNSTTGALAERRGTAVPVAATRSKQATSLASMVHKASEKGVASPYWKPETHSANGQPADDDKMPTRSLRSRAQFS